MMIGRCPVTPIDFSTASMPTSCSAMYGMVATMPVIATSSASVGEPKRARTKSAGVTKPWMCETDQSRISTRKTIG
ncbi:hypothetical protein GCM10018955_61940 [Planomonospora venezuelensis]